MKRKGFGTEQKLTFAEREEVKEESLEESQEDRPTQVVIPQSETLKAPILELEITEGLDPENWTINACGLFEGDAEYLGR